MSREELTFRLSALAQEIGIEYPAVAGMLFLIASTIAVARELELGDYLLPWAKRHNEQLRQETTGFFNQEEA